MEAYPPVAEGPRMIQNLPTHIQYSFTESARFLRNGHLGQAFESTNEAVLALLADIETRPASAGSEIARRFNQLVDDWFRDFEGPSEPTIWVGPPGVEKGPRYWEEYRMLDLHRVGQIWSDDESEKYYHRHKGAPPLRYVCGAICWQDIEARDTPAQTDIIMHFGGVLAHIFVCRDFWRDDEGNLRSRALDCRGDCRYCSKAKDTGKTMVIQRADYGEWRRIAAPTVARLKRTRMALLHFALELYSHEEEETPELALGAIGEEEAEPGLGGPDMGLAIGYEPGPGEEQ